MGCRVSIRAGLRQVLDTKKTATFFVKERYNEVSLLRRNMLFQEQQPTSCYNKFRVRRTFIMLINILMSLFVDFFTVQ